MALTAGSALAADLPSVKAPLVVPPPPPLWTGFYVGVNAGGTFGGNSGLTSSGVDLYDDDLPAAAGAAGALSASASGIHNDNSGGFVGGAQVGFNYQFVSGTTTPPRGTRAVERDSWGGLPPGRALRWINPDFKPGMMPARINGWKW